MSSERGSAMAIRRGGQGNLPIDVATQWLRIRVEPGADEIPEFRQDLERLAARLHVTIRWEVPCR